MAPRLPSWNSPVNSKLDSNHSMSFKSEKDEKIRVTSDEESAARPERYEGTYQSNTNAITSNNINPFNSTPSSYGMFPGGNIGMGGFGYGSPMLGSPLMGMGGPLISLNQFLYSVQNVIFSLSQAVQIVGMNAQGLKQLLESATAMFDHIIASLHELVEPQRAESPDERKRRRRVRAMRWAFITALSYAGYKLLRSLRQRQQRSAIAVGPGPMPYQYNILGNLNGYPGYQQQPQHYGSNPYGGGYGTGHGSWNSHGHNYGGQHGAGSHYM